MLFAWPSVPIASEPMAIASIAAPVALAVYAAWVHITWSGSLKTEGLGAAVVGAAIGTWLGLHEVSGLFSAFTAVLGAVLGANLAVLVRDLVRGTPPVASNRRRNRSAELDGAAKSTTEMTADDAEPAPAMASP